jgi:cellulose synthase/poly-beta-1,6-N-acetylglucosamine synthase-like glycosyltransferase
MFISIIIACKKNNPYLEECLRYCLGLWYPEFEIIVLPDTHFEYAHPRVKIIPTGSVTPPQKRNKILRLAGGELYAFIDDDAYPKEDWLTVAVKHFEDSGVAAIGGPAITPPQDSLSQIASGLIYESALVSDGFAYRYRPGKLRQVEDYPSCNFIIRRNVFEELGGFRTNFWPGEDTFLCLEIIKKLHRKILYVPDLVVFHHRRPLFRAHLKQVSNYALHRGYFAKRFPQTSLKFSYFIPSLFVIALIILGIAASIMPSLRILFVPILLFYLTIILLPSFFNLRNRHFNLLNLNLCFLTFLVFFGIIITHFMYGIYFIKGLFAKRLREEIESRNCLSAIKL